MELPLTPVHYLLTSPCIRAERADRPDSVAIPEAGGTPAPTDWEPGTVETAMKRISIGRQRLAAAFPVRKIVMWIIGLLIGLLVGGFIFDEEGAVVGAVFGAITGLWISLLKQNRVVTELQARVRALETGTGVREEVGTSEATAQPAATGRDSAAAAQTPPQVTASETAPPAAQTPSIQAQDQIAKPGTPEGERAEAPATTQPGMAEVTRLWNWLTGGNALVRVGVIVLFFGVAFLLKYAYEHTHLPIELRLTGVAIGAIVMLVIGWRLRTRKPVYALAIQGGGVGVLYLVVFGAFRLFGLLPGEAAFVLLIAIAALSAMLAILQNAQSLAVLGVSGGFLAPILASTGSGSHVMLFSYYVVLNLGILGMALYKAWRPLNVLGFGFTFGIGSLWGARFYRDDLFVSTEPFLVFFTLLYVLIAIIFAFRQAPRLKHYVDSTLIFGTPLVAFGLQTRLVRPFEYGAAWSAIALAAVYLGLAAVLYRRHQETLRMLVEAFLALGIIFVTLAIPLAVDGRWTSAAWALEGAAAYWVGVHQGRKAPRVFGLLLQLAAGVAFLGDVQSRTGDMPILNTFYMGTVFIALAGLFCNYTIERHAAKVGHTAMQVSIAIFAWGLAWWVFGGLHEIHEHVPRAQRISVSLLFLAGSCTVFSILFGRGWWIARFPALALPPLMAIALLQTFLTSVPAHPLAGFGFLAWPLAFALHFYILRRDDTVRMTQPDRGIPQLGYVPIAHAAGVWLLAAAGALELSWQIDHVVAGTRVWSLIGWALVPVILIITGSSRAVQQRWPVSEYAHAYLWKGIVPLVAFAYLWSLYANWDSNGNPAPLPYVPFLNPLDIAQMLVFAAAIGWWRSLQPAQIEDAARLPANWKWGLFGGIVFFWLNGVLLRTLHHWGGVPYDFGAMLRSPLAQTAVSIFWTLLALTAMLFATRRINRWLWLTGAALMGVVVVKLFIIDLAKVGGVERIVSFLAVGVLMLVIGYVAPVPPRQQTEAA